MNVLNALTLYCTMFPVFGDDPFGTSPRQDLPFMNLAEYDGVLPEEHYVITDDGYNLTVFRIPEKKTCAASKGPIIFMHGLYLSGDDCLVPGPGKAHCYNYADDCYDVWVPNVRGNYYSRKHITLNPDTDPSFWNFSIDEIGTKDVPAILDYVLLKTGVTEIPYVGHSQGIAVLLILLSKKPEYNTKIKVAFGLSPTVFLYHSKFIVLKFQALIAPAAELMGPVLYIEILRRGGVLQNSAEILCGSSDLSYPFCSAIIFATFGYNKYQITNEVLPVIFGHAPSSTSLKNFIHWGQIQKQGFAEFDYGAAGNLVKYGQLDARPYNMSRVTAPLRFIGSLNDNVANVTDVKMLTTILPNASLCVLPDTTITHLDFIYGKDVPHITNLILYYLKTGNFTCT